MIKLLRALALAGVGIYRDGWKFLHLLGFCSVQEKGLTPGGRECGVSVCSP